jgi:two-component system OmpR family sensor kinase
VKTLSQFAADASHELRTPLAVIRTSAELSLRRARSPEVYRESLHEIAEEAERMTQLVEDLLSFARSGAQASEMPKEPLDLCSLLEETCAEVRGLAELRQIRLRVPMKTEPVPISGNRSALRRLFLALLDNALKYSHRGSEVIVEITSGGDLHGVSVQDFGPGISPADLPHIFKRFYRADKARSEGGFGLGLSLAQSIAQAHGAAIEVTSAEGAGSTFRVAFRAGVAQPGTPRVAVYQP